MAGGRASGAGAAPDPAAGGAVNAAHDDDDAICATLFSGLVFFLGCVRRLCIATDGDTGQVEHSGLPFVSLLCRRPMQVKVGQEVGGAHSGADCGGAGQMQSGGAQGAAAAGDPVVWRCGCLGGRRIPP